ncbi:MAG: pyrroline-5-carboxylate reductase [Oscillospiraceae bacterium]|nr:pyrroline-5-carboxylate reductase [Oscillospiraceae bacterium]
MTYGFIGTGSMGGAIARALSKSVPAGDIYLSNRTREKAEKLASEIGANVSDNGYIAANCDYIFLGVKPQMMGDTLSGIRDALRSRNGAFTLVSMAAGLPIKKIKDLAGGDYPVIRIMPNLACSVGESMTLYTASENVTPSQIAAFRDAMRCSGILDELPEKLIDAGSAISGCGGGFACLFVEAMADGGVRCGLPREKALKYAEQMLVGMGRLLVESGSHPGKVKDDVCSPGGSTIAGIEALEKGAFRGAVMDAVEASFIKTVELGK